MLDKYGLNPLIKKTKQQLADIEQLTGDGLSQGLSGESLAAFVKQKVPELTKNRVGAAESPLGKVEPGVTSEHPDNPHELSADDVVSNDKRVEKIVAAIKQEDVVGSATKSIQIEIDNLTSKIDKLLGSRKNFIDAVSSPPNPDDIVKEVRATASKVSKFQKLIMDKMAEYQNKKMNLSLTTVVAAMPSSMRAMFGDQKFLNTQETVKQYNSITNGLVDQMEGILTAKLDINNLIKKADIEAISGSLWADPTSQSVVGDLLDLGGGGSGGSGGGISGVGGEVPQVGGTATPGSSSGGEVTSINTDLKPRTPKVPICYAEEVVAQAIAVNKDKIAAIAANQHSNYNRFLEGLQSQLTEEENKQKEQAEDMSQAGKVASISDEAPAAAYEPIGGSNYYTQNGVPCTGGSGTGFKVDIVVPTGGWYDNGFATINDGGAGYYVDTADGGGVSGTGTTTGISATGGSGSGLKLDFTISGGKITGITTNTAGSNYENGDVLTISQGSQAAINPTTYSTFTLDKVRGTISRMSSGGIKIKDPGTGYSLSDVLVINQPGSDANAAIVIIQVLDFGSTKATAGPVTPGDNQGSNGAWVPPKIPKKPKIPKMQSLSDMIQKVPGMQGNMTQAFDFKNIVGNIFPFEAPPNMAVSDYFTLLTGGAGLPETQMPDSSSIDKAISNVEKVAPPTEALDFAVPSPNTPPINLESEVETYDAGITDADWDDAMNASQAELDDSFDMF